MRKHICYIHVWPHKTGTTSIQWFLQENGADLLKHGFSTLNDAILIIEMAPPATVWACSNLHPCIECHWASSVDLGFSRDSRGSRCVRVQSTPPRIGQAALQVEPRNLHLAANSRNQHEQPRICILKVEEQHNTPVRLRVAMDETVFSQIRYERVLNLKVTPHCFGDDDVQHRHEMRHLFRFRTSHKRHVAREFLKKIIYGQFVISRMQHPLAQHIEMMQKILRGGIHASSRHQENLSCVWISHSRSWRKGADV